ncbi:hypothetical protein D3C72_2002590 [compost metagenome]
MRRRNAQHKIQLAEHQRLGLHAVRDLADGDNQIRPVVLQGVPGTIQCFTLYGNVGIWAVLDIVTDILGDSFQWKEIIDDDADIIIEFRDVSYPTLKILHRI